MPQNLVWRIDQFCYRLVNSIVIQYQPTCPTSHTVVCDVPMHANGWGKPYLVLNLQNRQAVFYLLMSNFNPSCILYIFFPRHIVALILLGACL